MRILFYSHAYYPSIGGVEYLTRLLAREFLAAGHPTTIVTQVPADSWQADAGDADIVRRPHRKVWSEMAGRHDLILCNGFSAVAICQSILNRLPLVFIQYNWTLPASHGHPMRIAGNALRSLYLRAGRGHICTAGWVRDQLRPKRSIVIPCPIKLQDYQEPETEGGTDGAEVIFIGRLIEGKGIQTILKALAILRTRKRPTRLVVVGTGPLLPTLRQLAQQLDIEPLVEFTGPIPFRQLLARLKRSRVLTLCSDTYPEGFGIVVAEALACGKPVIVSDQPALMETAGPAGLVVPRANPEVLADRLDRLLGDPELYQRLAAEAAVRARAFAAEQVCKSYLDYLGRVLN